LSDGLSANIHPENTRFGFAAAAVRTWTGRSSTWRYAAVCRASHGGVVSHARTRIVSVAKRSVSPGCALNC